MHSLIKSRVWLGVLALLLIIGLQTASAAPLRIAYIESPINQHMLQALQQQYQSMYKGQQVILVPVGRGEVAELLPRWLLTGEKADVFLVSDQVIASLKGMEVVQNLNVLRWRDIRLDDAFTAFPRGIQDVFSDQRGIIGIPITATADIFQYNEDVLYDLGLPPLSAIGNDWTWHDMIDLGRRVSGSARDRYMLHLDLEFFAIYFLAHGPVLSPEDGSVMLYNEGNVNILRLAQEAIQKERISPPPSAQRDVNQRFQRGQLVMRRVSMEAMQPQAVARSAGSWQFAWDITPWPKSPFSHVRPALGEASGLIVAAGSRNLPEVVDLLQIALSTRGQAAMAQAANVYPARLDVWAETIQRSQAGQAGPPANQMAFLTTLADWQHFLIPSGVDADLEAVAIPLVAVLEGALDAESGLRMTHRYIEQLLKQDR